MINTYTSHKLAAAAILRHVKAAAPVILQWYINEQIAPPLESLLRVYDRWLYTAIDRFLPDEREHEDYALTQRMKKIRNRYIVIGRQSSALFADAPTKKARGIIPPAALELSQFILDSWRYVMSAAALKPINFRHHSEIGLFQFEQDIEDKLCLHFYKFWLKLRKDLQQLLPYDDTFDFFLKTFASIVGWSIGASTATLGSRSHALLFKITEEEKDEDDKAEPCCLHLSPCALPIKEHLYNNIFR